MSILSRSGMLLERLASSGGAVHTLSMPYELLYNDLLKVTPEDYPDFPAIYWLRLLREHALWVALVTEVPLNPGSRMPENEGVIRRHLERRFNVDSASLKFYRILPRGYKNDTTSSIVAEDNSSISRDDLEASLGLQLPALLENRELRRRVMELGGAEIRYETRQVFEALPLTRLPPLRDTFQCKYRDQANWAPIADESARIVEAVGPLKPKVDYIAAAKRSSLGGGDLTFGGDLRWLVSLFSDPIIIDGGDYTNGRNRSCALCLSGAPRAAVVTGHKRVAAERTNDWQYEGDG